MPWNRLEHWGSRMPTPSLESHHFSVMGAPPLSWSTLLPIFPSLATGQLSLYHFSSIEQKSCACVRACINTRVVTSTDPPTFVPQVTLQCHEKVRSLSHNTTNARFPFPSDARTLHSPICLWLFLTCQSVTASSVKILQRKYSPAKALTESPRRKGAGCGQSQVTGLFSSGGIFVSRSFY